MPLPRGLHDGQRHEGELGDADAVRGDARREVESVARVGRRRRVGGGTKPEESRGRESGREESTIYIERLLRFLMTWTHILRDQNLTNLQARCWSTYKPFTHI
jgi:hypothetical protein